MSAVEFGIFLHKYLVGVSDDFSCANQVRASSFHEVHKMNACPSVIRPSVYFIPIIIQRIFMIFGTANL